MTPVAAIVIMRLSVEPEKMEVKDGGKKMEVKRWRYKMKVKDGGKSIISVFSFVLG